jgi:peptide/nickel transport system permease protein
VTDGVTSSFISLPAFVTALLLVFVFAIKVRVFPAIGWTPLTKSLGGNLRTAALPVISLSLAPIAVMQRVLRADIIATLQQDFIILARAKGLPTWKILLRHALRPSSFSLLTVAGLTLGTLLGGTVIIETVFSLPGLGQLLVTAILNKDLVAVQGTVAVIALGYVTVNLVIDLAYLVLDPRVRRA